MKGSEARPRSPKRYRRRVELGEDHRQPAEENGAPQGRYQEQDISLKLMKGQEREKKRKKISEAAKRRTATNEGAAGIFFGKHWSTLCVEERSLVVFHISQLWGGVA